jgi:transposase
VTAPAGGRAGDAAALPAAGRLDEIPGLGSEAAAALIADIGLDMTRFPAPQALVSRAGLTPTARQSGPRKGRGTKGRGTTYAKCSGRLSYVPILCSLGRLHRQCRWLLGLQERK